MKLDDMSLPAAALGTAGAVVILAAVNACLIYPGTAVPVLIETAEAPSDLPGMWRLKVQEEQSGSAGRGTRSYALRVFRVVRSGDTLRLAPEEPEDRQVLVLGEASSTVVEIMIPRAPIGGELTIAALVVPSEHEHRLAELARVRTVSPGGIPPFATARLTIRNTGAGLAAHEE